MDVNEEFFLIHHLVFPLLLPFGYEEYQDIWWDYSILSPLNCWNGEEGLFFPPAYIFLPYSLGIAPVLPVYKNMICSIWLNSSCSLTSHAGECLEQPRLKCSVDPALSRILGWMTHWSEFWQKLLFLLVDTNLLIKPTQNSVACVFVVHGKFPSFHGVWLESFSSLLGHDMSLRTVMFWKWPGLDDLLCLFQP